jgi:hypothetical protein
VPGRCTRERCLIGAVVFNSLIIVGLVIWLLSVHVTTKMSFVTGQLTLQSNMAVRDDEFFPRRLLKISGADAFIRSRVRLMSPVRPPCRVPPRFSA